MKTSIPLSVPLIGGNAWKYVKDCLDTQWVSSVGRYVNQFEIDAARYTGARHAVAASTGTAALHVALLTAGIGPGDGVVVPALTFIATANAVAYCGATCVFADCDPRRFNLDLDALEALLDRPPKGLKIKAVVAVHILGYPVDMPRLMKLARRRGVAVIEDAAESIGSFLDGRHTGTFGKAGILSFNGNKIITCGGGGMLLTDDSALARRAKHLTTQARASSAEYLHDEIGYNYRLTNVAAALGLSQLELLPRYLEKRAAISSWYARQLPDAPVEPVGPGVSWNRWLLSVECSSAVEKTRLLARLNETGCEARPLWIPVPLQKPFRRFPVGPIPNARRAYDTVINIPSATSLTEAQVGRVAKILRGAALTRLLI